MDLATEQRHLEEAERHIADGERLVAETKRSACYIAWAIPVRARYASRWTTRPQSSQRSLPDFFVEVAGGVVLNQLRQGRS